MSFFGLMPIAGILVPGFSDMVGMRPALGVAAILFAVGAFVILRAAGRKACEASATIIPEATAAPDPVAVP